MITQSFLTEFELSLLKSYNRASKKNIVIAGNESNFIGASKYQNEFLAAFMDAFKEQHAILERELRKGGNNPEKLMDKILKEVESKVRMSLFQKSRLDQTAFQTIARDLKKDIRSVFYENYLNVSR